MGRRKAREQPKSAPWKVWMGCGVVLVLVLLYWAQGPTPTEEDLSEIKELQGRKKEFKDQHARFTAYRAVVVAEYPHDQKAFTQGLIVHKGAFVEGTGLEGESNIRRVDITTGDVVAQTDLPVHLFGEGIALHGHDLMQLTWRNKLGRVYDVDTLVLKSEFKFDTHTGQGWGVTHDGKNWLVSDGSQWIHIWDSDYHEVGRVEVKDLQGRPIHYLNELEYFNGMLYANIWFQEGLAVISPLTWRLVGWVDFKGVYQRTDTEDVMNGIAYDSDGDRLFVTGKLWNKMYEIRIEEKNRA